MKYGILGIVSGTLAVLTQRGSLYTSATWYGEPTLFSTHEAALSAVQQYNCNLLSSLGRIRIVGVEETPGETKREVVELKGIVNLDGLKFAIVSGTAPIRVDEQYYVGQAPDGVAVKGTGKARLFDTLPDALLTLHRYKEEYRTLSCFSFNPLIVGIREVTSKPSWRIIELTPKA